MARKDPTPLHLDEVVRQRIRELRVERGLTQEQVCERAGISVDAVSRIEGGARVPTLETIERLAKAFAVTPATFMERAPAVSEPGYPWPLRRVVSLLDGQPEELQRLAEQVITLLVRAFSAGGRGGKG